MDIQSQAKQIKKQYKNKANQVFVINCPNIESRKGLYLKVRQSLKDYFVIFSATKLKEHSINVYTQRETDSKTFQELKQIALRTN